MLGQPAQSLRSAQLAVATVFFIHGVVFASWTAHVPHVKESLGLTEASLGIGLLGAPVGSVAATVLGGALLTRAGSRIVVRITLVGYALSGVLVGLAGSLGELFAALAIWGAFMGLLDVSMNTQAVAVERRLGRPIMSGLHGRWSLGAFTGAGLGVVGVAIGLSLTAQLLIVGVAALLVGVPLGRRLLIEDAPAESGDHGWRLTPVLLLLGGIALAGMLCEGAAADWTAVYLHESQGTTAAVAGVGYAVFALAMVTVRLLGDRLIARFGPRRVVAALAGVASIVLAVALVVGGLAATLVGFGTLGFGLAAVVPVCFSAAGRVPGVAPGAGIATVSTIGWTGFVVGPPLIGFFADRTSLTTALFLLPVLTALIALTVWASPAVRRLDAEGVSA